ncbi:MAG: energy-coupling factor transporter transmembrane component T [Aggregatilineales bacterium]|nr:energy-coupling factor transporter transmembrane protein EcfT [Chloroflexota bacterium]HOA24919.1 energy-coupling factor transporter transmembrane component T [Aggregatilineales bacterium]HPV06955.1 energy-coupling factor transporter transmembrane component T [Aggregatilineales bacterium]HQE17903.1 energy-coupling factor transporter transmembrane component T [Aggregatilineales bacterium]
MKPLITYRPGSSLLHRLHPLTKLAWLIGMTVLVFAVRHWWLAVGVLAAVLAAFAAFRLPLGEARGARLFAFTALALFGLQAVFLDVGRTLIEVGPVTVTSGGVEAGVFVAARFLSVVLLSYLFVFTTSPNELAYGLMQAGLPYRFGFTLVTALRLVPIFEREAQMVYRAQVMRGAAYDRKNLSRFLLLARQFFLPMLVSALGKVDALAVSMEGRCFGKHPNRTYLREVRFARRDASALALLVAAVSLPLLLRF